MNQIDIKVLEFLNVLREFDLDDCNREFQRLVYLRFYAYRRQTCKDLNQLTVGELRTLISSARDDWRAAGSRTL